MKTIKNSKEITNLEVDDKVIFGNLEYSVRRGIGYFLSHCTDRNDEIFKVLNINKRDFIENLGIDANCNVDFPETKSLEALTAIVSALFKEWEKQNELPKTYEDVCDKLFDKGHYYTDGNGDIHFVGWMNDCPNNASTKHQLECILAKNKLANVARYLNGEWCPVDFEGSSKWVIFINAQLNDVGIRETKLFSEQVNIIFKSKELAHQAIEILGEETIKLALEPLY